MHYFNFAGHVVAKGAQEASQGPRPREAEEEYAARCTDADVKVVSSHVHATLTQRCICVLKEQQCASPRPKWMSAVRGGGRGQSAWRVILASLKTDWRHVCAQ